MQPRIKLNPALLQELANDVFLELSPAEIQDILAIEANILDRFEKVLAIDTQGVAPLFYPCETPRKYLRKDEPEGIISQSEVLANAAHTSGPYVVISRVVK